eukprot:296312-Rhodomonas_salina.1
MESFIPYQTAARRHQLGRSSGGSRSVAFTGVRSSLSSTVAPSESSADMPSNAIPSRVRKIRALMARDY